MRTKYSKRLKGLLNSEVRTEITLLIELIENDKEYKLHPPELTLLDQLKNRIFLLTQQEQRKDLVQAQRLLKDFDLEQAWDSFNLLSSLEPKENSIERQILDQLAEKIISFRKESFKPAERGRIKNTLIET